MTADKIAIIGMVGRFPGANSMEAFWDVVVRGTETIEDIPLDTVARHIGIRAASHPEYVARAGMVANPLMFDRELFGMSARETELTNPQHPEPSPPFRRPLPPIPQSGILPGSSTPQPRLAHLLGGVFGCYATLEPLPHRC